MALKLADSRHSDGQIPYLQNREFSTREQRYRVAPVAAISLALPVLPGIDALFGFAAPPLRLWLFSLAVVAAYALATEAAKGVFYPRMPRRRGGWAG